MTWLDAARDVLETQTCAYVHPETGVRLFGNKAERDGILLDMQTANVLVLVHDALKPENQAVMTAMPVERAARAAWKLVRR